MSNTQGNADYGLSTPQGASAEACCNTCYFELPYCIQAYWYSYEGCVVNQVCPSLKKIFRFQGGDDSLKASSLRDRYRPQSNMLTLHSSRPTPSLGAERVSAPPVRKGPSKAWFTRTTRTLRSGVPEISQGHVDRRMIIYHIEPMIPKDDSGERQRKLEARMKNRTSDFHVR